MRPLVLAIASMLTLDGINLRAQEKNAGEGESLAAGCIACHQGGEVFQRQFPSAKQLIRFDESKIWDSSDYHKLAFAALSTPLGKQMSRLLNNDVTKAVECLACHALDKAPNVKPAEKTAASFDTFEGVNCQACHSIARPNDNGTWAVLHFTNAVRNWRPKTPAEKALLDQRDLRHPVVRAETCVSCHVGNIGQGKFVTHEMFAAGHPPLLGIEVMAYSRDQRMHYRPPDEVDYIRKLSSADAARRYHVRPDENHATRQMAVGAIVTLRASVKLIAEESALLSETRPVLDFAQFDCYSCHHELAGDSWRQKVKLDGKPGRVRPRFWAAPLARVVSEHAAAGAKLDTKAVDEFDRAYRDLIAELDRHPFGGQQGAEKPVQKKAEALAEWCDQFLKEQEKLVYTVEQTRSLRAALLRRLTMDEGGFVPDAAQQMVWALGVLTDIPGDPEKLPAGYGALNKLLPLHVRPAQLLSDPMNLKSLRWLGDLKQERLMRFARYDPAELRKALQPLVKPAD